MKKILTYLFFCYLGILAHIIYFKGIPALFRSEEVSTRLQESLVEEAGSPGELSQGFAKIVLQQRKIKRMKIQSFGLPETGNFDFLYDASDNKDSFVKKLEDYSRNEESHREDIQIDLLEHALTYNEKYSSLLRVSLGALELIATKSDDWSQSDRDRVQSLATRLLEAQASDSYEAERIKNNFRSLGLEFEINN